MLKKPIQQCLGKGGVCNLSRLLRNWLDETRMKRHGNTSATNNKLLWTIVLSDRANNSPTVSVRFISDRQEEEANQVARKKWLEETLPAIINKANEDNSVVLFGDEVSFAMWGSLARTWAPISQQPTVKTTGIRNVA